MKKLVDSHGLMSLSHHGCFYNDENVYLTMLKTSTNMSKLLIGKGCENKQPMVQSFVWKVFVTNYIVNAVADLHDLNILHLDLKTDNILYQDYFTYYLTDFGFSKQSDSVSDHDTSPLVSSELAFGTRSFMAPECFYGNYYRQSDVFALALTISQIWLVNDEKDLDAFYNKPKQLELLSRCTNTEFKSNNPNYQLFSVFYAKTVAKMLSNDFNSRPVGNVLRNEFAGITESIAQQLLAQESMLDGHITENQDPETRQYLEKLLASFDVSGMLHDFVTSKRDLVNNDPSYRRFMLKILRPFFEQYECEGASFLGFSINDYFEGSVSGEITNEDSVVIEERNNDERHGSNNLII